MFLHREHERQMEDQGFVVLDFLTAQELQALTETYEQQDAGLQVPFYTSMWSADAGYRHAVHHAVCGVLMAPLARVVQGYAPFAGGFLVKHASATAGEVVLHQDWSYVDERTQRTLILWCPLRDVDVQDGCLGVIPGSHKILNCLRTNGDSTVVAPYTGREHALYHAHGVELPMRAGQAVLYDARLLHASRPNRSGRLRVAAGLATAPAPLQLRHYYSLSSESIEEYEVPEDFYWRLVQPGKRPSGPGVRRTERALQANPTPTLQELHALCAAASQSYVGPGVRVTHG